MRVKHSERMMMMKTVMMKGIERRKERKEEKVEAMIDGLREMDKKEQDTQD